MATSMIVAFDEFSSILGRWAANSARGDKRPWPSEDTICSFLTASWIVKGCPPSSIELEVPHPEIEKNQGMSKTVDIYLCESGEPSWIEVKLDKKAPKSVPFEKTERFVDLLTDFVRLALIKSGHRFAVYVAPNEIGDQLRKRFPVGTRQAVDKESLSGRLRSSKLDQIESLMGKLPGAKFDVQCLDQRSIGQMTCAVYQICF